MYHECKAYCQPTIVCRESTEELKASQNQLKVHLVQSFHQVSYCNGVSHVEMKSGCSLIAFKGVVVEIRGLCTSC